ncbi:hypothetical protein [Paracoccus aminovorans]|uniref:hypothetical protein n=1 Tax=Paracoccus aminovorans TaxID=34004 RepID=UPI002B2579ED|nr:hypothetical protein [Paracoccus aminovorans]
MNRRAVLAGLPAVVLGTGGAQAQGSESPVMMLFRSWKAMFDFVEGPALNGCTAAERAPFHERETDLVRQIIEAPALDALDVCAKLTAFTCDGQHFADDDGLLSDTILREARAITNIHRYDEIH